MSDELAIKICNQLDLWVDLIDNLRPRWEITGGLYYNDPAVASHFVCEGIPPLPVSLWTQKCDRLVGDIVGSIVTPSPTVQVIDDGDEGTNVPNVEMALDSLAHHAKWSDTLYQSVWNAANFNVGPHRILPKVDVEGRVIGLETDWIAPEDFFVYPMNVEKISQLQSVGHRFYLTRDEFQEAVKAKLYKLPKGVEVPDGNDPEEYTLQYVGFRLTEGSDDLPASAGDNAIEMFDVLHKVDGEWRILTVVRNNRIIVRDEPYPYELPWYSYTRLCKTEKNIISNDSVGWKVQGYVLMHGDYVNALTAGALMTAYPIMFIRGGWSDDMTKDYQPGQLIRIQDEGELGAVPIPFNADAILASMREIERLIDGTIGISNLNSSQPSTQDMTATEASILASADQRRAATYLDAASESVEYDFELLLMYLKAHYEELVGVYGNSVTIEDEAWADKSYRLEVTGMSGASNPQVVISSLMQAREWTQDPRSTTDYGKLEQKALMNLPGLTFDTDSLRKDAISELVEAATQIEAQGIDPRQVLVMGLQAMQGGMGVPQQPMPEMAGATGMDGSQGVPVLPPEPGTGGTFPTDQAGGDLSGAGQDFLP